MYASNEVGWKAGWNWHVPYVDPTGVHEDHRCAAIRPGGHGGGRITSITGLVDKHPEQMGARSTWKERAEATWAGHGASKVAAR